MSTDKPYEPNPVKKGDLFITNPTTPVQLVANTHRQAWTAKGRLKCFRTTDTRVYYKTAEGGDSEGYQEKSAVSFHKFSEEAAKAIDESFEKVEQRRAYLQTQLDVVMKVLTEELDKALTEHEQFVNRTFDGERYKYNRFEIQGVKHLTPIDEVTDTPYSLGDIYFGLKEFRDKRFIPTIELIGRISWLEYSLDNGLTKRRKGKIYGVPGDVYVLTELGKVFLAAVEIAREHRGNFKSDEGFKAARERFIKLQRERKTKLSGVQEIREERRQTKIREMAEAAKAAEAAHFAALEAAAATESPEQEPDDPEDPDGPDGIHQIAA